MESKSKRARAAGAALLTLVLRGIPAAFAAAVVVSLVGAEPGAALQRPVAEADLPRHVAEQIVAFFNDPTTVRFTGATSIPAGRTLLGDVGVLDGPVRLGGAVDGVLVVVNGNLELERGASVTGDVLVVGGRVVGAEEASIGGTLTVYEERLRYVQRGERLTYTAPRQPIGPIHESPLGRSRFTFRTGTNYNRVEGLPVMFGPIVETSGRNPLRIEGFGIWRSTSGLSLQGDELGYSVLLEQGLFARGDAGVGFTLHSEVLPIERWGLTDVEASLSTFFLHRDYRDYYDARGWSGFVRSGVPRTPLVVLLEYREEDHRFAQVGDPWSIRGGDDWRAQPLVGDGQTRSVGAELLFDNRNETRLPSSGWLIRATARAGVGGTLALPAHSVTPAEGPPAVPVPERGLDNRYRTGFVDLRRYNRVSPTSRLSVRGLVGGSLTGDALPPQLQHAIGGEGSLPGHHRFSGDCGARDPQAHFTTTVRRGENRGDEVVVPAFVAYGCDRIALFQMEYQGSFDFPRDWMGGGGESSRGTSQWDLYPFIDRTLRWSVFFNAGRGWALPERAASPLPLLRRENSETMMDIGAGVFMGAIGVYWAVPLDGGNRGLNFFVRLSQSF